MSEPTGEIVTTPERTIGIAHKLYQLRRAAHLFLGSKYSEEVAHMQTVLDRVKEQTKMDTLQAAMWLAARVDRSDVREVALIFAAALDEIEPEDGAACVNCGEPL